MIKMKELGVATLADNPSLTEASNPKKRYGGGLSPTLVGTRLLTCPNGSRWLLVSLSFWKETSCRIQCAPVAGESGCT